MNSKKEAPKQIAVLLYPGVEPMDFQGPCGIFDLWRLEAAGPRVIFVAESMNPVVCAYGRRLMPQYDFSNCPSFDALLVPGGRGRHEAVKNATLIKFLKERGEHCDSLLSVCTGVFLLASAGLISGRQVTTHWENVEELAQNSSLHVQGDQRYIRDGNLWTAAGIYSGIDMALAFIDSFDGTLRIDGTVRTHEAGKVQMAAQYFPSTERYRPDQKFSSLVPDFVRSEFRRAI